MHLTGVSPLVGIQWLTFWTIENGALIDCRFNGQRQAEPPEVARRAQGMSIGFRRDRGLLFRGYEIRTTSNEHERIKKWIGDLMAVYFEEASIEIMPTSHDAQSAQAGRRRAG
jgi:hypothetical protein